MPTATYIALANLTLTGNDTSITFSSIPATYRDLVLVVEATADADNNALVQFNGDTGNNYNDIRMLGYPINLTTSSADSNIANLITGTINSTRANFIMNIMDYSATDKHKTTLTRINNQASGVFARGGRWANTNAVNEVRVFLAAANFQSGTTFALYGIVS